MNCTPLQSLPEGGLPTSITTVEFFDHPLLKLKLEWEKGEDQSKIADILAQQLIKNQSAYRNARSVRDPQLLDLHHIFGLRSSPGYFNQIPICCICKVQNYTSLSREYSSLLLSASAIAGRGSTCLTLYGRNQQWPTSMTLQGRR